MCIYIFQIFVITDSCAPLSAAAAADGALVVSRERERYNCISGFPSLSILYTVCVGFLKVPESLSGGSVDVYLNRVL